MRGELLLPPLTLVVKPTKVKNFFFEKKQKILFAPIAFFFEYSSLFPSFSKSRTMPQVKHRVANVTSYGLQGAPITLQTDLSVLGASCTQPGAKRTTESKDRKIRPLGYFYGRWHKPLDEVAHAHTPFFRTRVKGKTTFPLPDFFPPCPPSAHVRLETDPNSKKRKKSKSRTGLQSKSPTFVLK